MASGFGSNCHMPAFCLPFPDSLRVSSSAQNIQNNGVRTSTNEFKIPTTLHSQLYREYSNNHTNGVCKDPTIRPLSDSTAWRIEEFQGRKNISSLNGCDYSITQTEDSTLAGTDRYSRDVTEEERTAYDTHSTSNTGSAVGLSKLFTRFGKRRKSACDLREYFSDTEREVKGKNKGKLRY